MLRRPQIRYLFFLLTCVESSLADMLSGFELVPPLCSDSVPLVPTAVFLEPRGASGGVSSSAWISDRGRGFLLFNAWVTLALPWIWYPCITPIGCIDLGTRVVRVMLRFWLIREWSVVVRVLHNVDLDP